jgi:hypothetical protein
LFVSHGCAPSFGTSDYRAPGWEQLHATAKSGDRFGGTRKDGTWEEVTARVIEGWMEGRHYCRFVYVGWTNAHGTQCETSFEEFATMHREIQPLPNAGREPRRDTL